MSKIQIILLIAAGILGLFYPLLKKLAFEKKTEPNKKQNSRQKTEKKRTRNIHAKKIKIHPGHIFLLAIAVFAVFGYLNSYRLQNNLNKNKCISYGRVTKYIYLYKSSKGYCYEFYRDNKVYQGFYSYLPNTLPIINKVFPVVLDCDDPENNRILILPKDFNRYNLYFPDSLNWLIQYD